jgi:hypothetical protein
MHQAAPALTPERPNTRKTCNCCDCERYSFAI